MAVMRERAGVTGHLVVRMAPSDEDQRALLVRILEGSALIHHVHEDAPHAWIAAFLGREKQAAPLLASLVSAGLPIVDFHLKRENLADTVLTEEEAEDSHAAADNG